MVSYELNDSIVLNCSKKLNGERQQDVGVQRYEHPAIGVDPQKTEKHNNSASRTLVILGLKYEHLFHCVFPPCYDEMLGYIGFPGN